MDAPFDTANVGMRERPKTDDINRLQSQLYRTIRELARAQLSGRASNASSASQSRQGWFGDGMRATPSASPAMSVVINAGIGFLYVPTDVPTDIGATDLENVDDLSPFKPSFLLAPLTFAVPAADATKSRIDIIEVRLDRRLTDSVPRQQLDIASKTFLPHSFYKTMTYGLDGETGQVTSPAASTAGISYKTGVAGLPGVAPTVTSGYVKIAEINVAALATTITGTEIVDRRKLLGPNGVVSATMRFRVLWNGGAPTITVQSINAPPGVDICAKPLTGGRSTANVYCAGGDFSQASFSCHLETPQSLGSNGSYMVQRTRMVSTFLTALTSLEQTAMASASTPAVPIGIGQQRALASIETLFINGATGVASITDTSLEDLIYTARFDLAYH